MNETRKGTICFVFYTVCRCTAMSLQLNTTTNRLLVSQPQLNFAPAEVGEEQFLLLRVGQQDIPEPVQVVAEGGYFQVAVQASPLRFGTKITFTPAPSGTFLHVRYAPKQAGRHTGELRLESGRDGQTIPLTGRTVGLLTRVLPSPVVVDAQKSRFPWPKAAIVLAVLGGGALAYWGVMRPATRQPEGIQTVQRPPATPVPPAAPHKQPTRTVPAIHRVPADDAPATAPAEPPVASTENPAPRATLSEAVAEPATERVMEAPTERPIATRTESTRTRLKESQPQAKSQPRPEPNQTEPAKKRPAPAKPRPTETPSPESDLERELNKKQ